MWKPKPCTGSTNAYNEIIWHRYVLEYLDLRTLGVPNFKPPKSSICKPVDFRAGPATLKLHCLFLRKFGCGAWCSLMVHHSGSGQMKRHGISGLSLWSQWTWELCLGTNLFDMIFCWSCCTRNVRYADCILNLWSSSSCLIRWSQAASFPIWQK